MPDIVLSLAWLGLAVLMVMMIVAVIAFIVWIFFELVKFVKESMDDMGWGNKDGK